MAVILINALVVIAVVVINYECLFRMNDWLPHLNLWSRFKVVGEVLGALLTHATEVWCFAVMYYLIFQSGHWGCLKGNFDGSLMGCVYFSFTTYTTISFGDISLESNL